MTGAALLLLHLAVAPPFEGEIGLRVQVEGQKADGRVVRSKAGGLRVDLTVLGGAEGASIPMTLLVPPANDDIVVRAVHPLRAFERADLRAPAKVDGRWRVKKLGGKKVLSRATTGWSLLDTKSGDVIEVWLDPSLGDGTQLARVQERMKTSHLGAWDALTKAGARGFPLRFVWKRKHGGVVEVTATKVTAMEVPARAFELPSDYRPSPVSLGAIGGGG